MKNKKEDRPEYGKVYSLIGGSNDKCIMNGNTWKESEVCTVENCNTCNKMFDETCVLCDNREHHAC